MFKIVRKEIVWGGKKLSIESGKIARQADGAVILTSGDTVILATVVNRFISLVSGGDSTAWLIIFHKGMLRVNASSCFIFAIASLYASIASLALIENNLH